MTDVIRNSMLEGDFDSRDFYSAKQNQEAENSFSSGVMMLVPDSFRAHTASRWTSMGHRSPAVTGTINKTRDSDGDLHNSHVDEFLEGNRQPSLLPKRPPRILRDSKAFGKALQTKFRPQTQNMSEFENMQPREF